MRKLKLVKKAWHILTSFPPSLQEPAGRDVLRWRQQLPPGAIHGTTGFCRACRNGWLGFGVIRGKILLPSWRALETVHLTHRQVDYFQAKDSFSAIVLRGHLWLWFQGKQCDTPGILFAGVCGHQLLCTDNSCFGCLQFHFYRNCKSLLWFKAQHGVTPSHRHSQSTSSTRFPSPKMYKVQKHSMQIQEADLGFRCWKRWKCQEGTGATSWMETKPWKPNTENPPVKVISLKSIH